MTISEVTYNPLTLAGFEEAIAKAEEERLSSAIDYAPISDEAYDGEKVDHRHLDEFCILRDYRIGCDPYKEGDFLMTEKGDVIPKEDFDKIWSTPIKVDIKPLDGLKLYSFVEPKGFSDE